MIPNLIPRTAWEEPGWTIDEHTGSGPHPFSRTQAVVIHYTAATSTPENEATVRDFIRRTQRDYATNRGYSIGYNWCTDRHGRIWELRGEDYKCAANGSSVTNDDPAILCLVNAAEPANVPMIAAVRDVIAHVERITGRTIGIKGHRDVRTTTCPGDGLYAQVLADTFRPAPPEEDPVRYMLKPPTDRPGGPWFLRWDGTWSYLTGRDRDIGRSQGLPEFDDIAQRYDNVHREVFGDAPKA